MSEQTELQSKMKMALFCWLIGWTGIHRKMMGYDNWWYMLVLSLVCGLGIFWQIYDLWMILLGKMTMADGRELEK
tara:strand:- start:4815 stop:5039 length:225 start_codon:yes stop_codon:yes gene_type:complete